ncbi:WD40 repeat domain-containing protein [bacterium]|nr:WD40 repeat domain-containing protein [bacterium]
MPWLLLCFLVSVVPAMAQETKDLHGEPLPTGAVQRLGTLAMRYGGVGGLAYLPDGRGVVLTGGRVDIWDLSRGTRQSSTVVSPAGLVSVQLRRDGAVLLLGDAAGTVCEWDPATLKELRSWDTGQKELRTACYSPDGKRVVTAANNPQGLKEWDLDSGRELIAIRSELICVRAGAIYGPEGTTAILGGGYDHNLERWDLTTGQLVRKWCGIYEAKHMALAPDQKSMTVGVEDRAVEWSLDTYQALRPYKHCPGEAARIFQVAYLPATDEVLCGGRDGTIHRWSRVSGERVFSWRPHQSVVAPFAVSPDEQWLLSYGTYQVAETNIRTGEPRLKCDRHIGGIEAVAFLPDGQRVVTGSSDETLRLWDAAAGKTLCLMPGATLGAYAVAVSPDGKRAAAGCKDGKLREFDLATGKPLGEYSGHLGYLRAVCYDGNGRLYSSADDGSIRVWEQGKPEAVAVLQGHRGGVLGLDVSAGGKQLASCGRDGTVRLWDVAAEGPAIGRPASRILSGPATTSHAGYVTAVRFTPDGKAVVSGGRDGHVLKWDVASGRKLLDIARGSWVNGLVCTPDGAQVLVGGSDGRVMAYNLQTGAAGVTRSHGSSVLGLALSPDGRWLLTGHQDTTALLWRVGAEGK